MTLVTFMTFMTFVSLLPEPGFSRFRFSGFLGGLSCRDVPTHRVPRNVINVINVTNVINVIPP
jgi:hypothetical protein